MNIGPAYISKYNSNHEQQILVLMITKVEGWHYLVVNKLFTLLRG